MRHNLTGDEQDNTAAVESETAEWLARQGSVPGAELHLDPDVTWLVQPGSAWSNAAAALRFAPESADARLTEIVRRYRRNGRGAGFWVSALATPDDVEVRLRRQGFRCRRRFPGMYCDLAALECPPGAPGGLELFSMENHAVFSRTRPHPCIGPISTAIRRYNLARIAALVRQRPRRVWEFMAKLDGQTVGGCTLFLGSQVAGVHNVCVVESARNRGIGRALVCHACQFARGQGYAGAVLIASGMGESVYRRAGFREVCRMAFWYSALRR